MNDWSIKRIVRHALGAIIVFFLLYALIDLLHLVLQPLAQPDQLESAITRHEIVSDDFSRNLAYWQQQSLQEPPPITRTVTVSTTLNTVTVYLELWISRTHPIALAVGTNTTLEQARLPFVQALFGRIEIDGNELQTYGSPIWSIDSETRLMHIKLEASKASNGYTVGYVTRSETARDFLPEHDKIVLQLEGVRPQYIDPLPDQATPNLVALDATMPDTLRSTYFSLAPLPDTASATSAPSVRESRQNFLQRLGGLIDVPLVSPVIFSLVEALPILMFWYWVSRRRQRRSPFVADLFGVIVGLMLFHFVVYFLNGSEQFGYQSSLMRGLSDRFIRWLSPYYSARVSPALGQGASYLAPIVLGVLLPAMLVQRTEPSSKQPRRWWSVAAQLIVAMSLIAGLIIPVAYVASLYDPRSSSALFVPMWTVVVFGGSLLTLLIWRLLRSLYRRLSRQPVPSTLTLLATLLIVATAVINAVALDNRNRWLDPVAWFVLSTILGAALLIGLVKLCRTLTRSVWQIPALPRWGRWLLILGALVLTIPMNVLTDPTWRLGYESDTMSLAFRLDDLIVYVWGAGVVWLMYQNGRKSQRVGGFTRLVGLLAASALLFSPTVRWFYIPVRFLLGLVLLFWLVRPTHYWRTLRRFLDRVLHDRLRLLDQILDLNAAEGAYKEFARKMKKKLADGEVAFVEYNERLEKAQRDLKELQDQATVAGRPVKEVALAFGPQPTAWQNAVHGAKWAFVFATPWIALYLRDFLAGTMPRQTYPLWGFVVDLVGLVARWMVLGFVFGYFYPYLRGKDGMQKGLGLFAVTAIAALPLMAVFNVSTEDWQASLFWILQVFTQCMLLGLIAFDYMTLRQGRYDWQMLFEVHGLTGVGASVSSILVAVGVTITTLLTTQATGLVTLALKFVLPQVPTDILPK